MKRIVLAVFGAAAILFTTLIPAAAQVSGQAFEGFRGNSSDPIQISADQLEVLDEQSTLTYTGNVEIRQGTSLIKTGELIVKYTRGTSGGQNDIEKLFLKGGLIATSQDNTATADSGVYDVKTEDITLEGDVVVSQGTNVATGCKLVANLKTNVARLLACKNAGGRVKSVFTPGSAPAASE